MKQALKKAESLNLKLMNIKVFGLLKCLSLLSTLTWTFSIKIESSSFLKKSKL